jgi:hypothetical protein
MTEPHDDGHPTPTPPAPQPATPTAADASVNHPGKTRTWLVGAVLVTAGVVAGSGATYALTAQATPAQGQFSNSGGVKGGYGRTGGGPGGGPGGPPGSANGNTASEGAPPSAAPPTQTG